MKKTMKILIAASLMVLSFNVNAKGQQGIYMTSADFRNDNLSYGAGSKIHLNNSLLTLPYLTIADHGKKIKLQKDEVYGYRCRDNKVYRFYNNAEFEVAESGLLTIYVQNEKVALSKGFKIKRNYFFSTTADGAIMPLTLNNLRERYRNTESVLDVIDLYLSNGDVTSYDEIRNTFKVNYVLGKALK